MIPGKSRRILGLTAIVVALVLVHGALHTWRTREREQDRAAAPAPTLGGTSDAPTVGESAVAPDQVSYVPPSAEERFSALTDFLRWRSDRIEQDKPGSSEKEMAILKGKYIGVYVMDELRELTSTPEGIRLVAEFLLSGEDIKMTARVPEGYPMWDYLRSYAIRELARRPGAEVDAALYGVLTKPLRTYEQLFAAKHLRDRDPASIERISEVLAEAFQAKVDAGPQPGQPKDETLFYGLALATKFDRPDLLPDLENWMLQMPEERGAYVYGRCFHTFPGKVQADIIRRLGPDHVLLNDVRLACDVSEPLVRDFAIGKEIAGGADGVEVELNYDPQLRLREFDIYFPWIVDGEEVDESSPANIDWLIARLEGYHIVYEQFMAVPGVRPEALAEGAKHLAQLKVRLKALREKQSGK